MKITTHIDKDVQETSIDICAKSTMELNQAMEAIKNIDDALIGKIDEKIVQVFYHQILYFDSIDKKTFAYTQNQVIEISKWLNEIEVSMPPHFFRCSKNSIVNLSKVKNFSPSFGSKILMNLVNGEKMFVSRKYVKGLYETLKGEK